MRHNRHNQNRKFKSKTLTIGRKSNPFLEYMGLFTLSLAIMAFICFALMHSNHINNKEWLDFASMM